MHGCHRRIKSKHAISRQVRACDPGGWSTCQFPENDAPRPSVHFCLNLRAVLACSQVVFARLRLHARRFLPLDVDHVGKVRQKLLVELRGPWHRPGKCEDLDSCVNGLNNALGRNLRF